MSENAQVSNQARRLPFRRLCAARLTPIDWVRVQSLGGAARAEGVLQSAGAGLTCSGGSCSVSSVSPLVAVTAAPLDGAGGGDLQHDSTMLQSRAGSRTTADHWQSRQSNTNTALSWSALLSGQQIEEQQLFPSAICVCACARTNLAGRPHGEAMSSASAARRGNQMAFTGLSCLCSCVAYWPKLVLQSQPHPRSCLRFNAHPSCRDEPTDLSTAMPSDILDPRMPGACTCRCRCCQRSRHPACCAAKTPRCRCWFRCRPSGPLSPALCASCQRRPDWEGPFPSLLPSTRRPPSPEPAR